MLFNIFSFVFLVLTFTSQLCHFSFLHFPRLILSSLHFTLSFPSVPFVVCVPSSFHFSHFPFLRTFFLSFIFNCIHLFLIDPFMMFFIFLRCASLLVFCSCFCFPLLSSPIFSSSRRHKTFKSEMNRSSCSGSVLFVLIQ